MPTFDEVTRGQQAMWARGDFHRIGVSQIVVGELLVQTLHVHAGERVLDVAGGAGNTALAAARRWADVTCTDYVPDLLEHAAARAAVEGLPLRTEVADAQALTGTLFELFRDWFGPVATVIARVDPGRAAAFTRDWLAVADQHNAATDGTCEIPAAYLEVVAVKAA